MRSFSFAGKFEMILKSFYIKCCNKRSNAANQYYRIIADGNIKIVLGHTNDSSFHQRLIIG